MAKKLNQACVLATNGGSSSIRFARYKVGESLEQLSHRYLGDPEKVKAAMQAVAHQGKVK